MTLPLVIDFWSSYFSLFNEISNFLGKTLVPRLSLGDSTNGDIICYFLISVKLSRYFLWLIILSVTFVELKVANGTYSGGNSVVLIDELSLILLSDGDSESGVLESFMLVWWWSLWDFTSLWPASHNSILFLTWYTD